MNQLIEVFNSEYRDGRSTIAPKLTSAAIVAIQSEHDSDVNNQSPMYDPDVLPHFYEAGDLDELFDKAVAPVEMECAPTGKCIWSLPSCRVCFPSKEYSFGPAIFN